MSYLDTLKRLRRYVEKLSPKPRRKKPKRLINAKPVSKRKRPKQKKKRTRMLAQQATPPPRSEPDVRELVEAFAPPPTPPGPISPALWVPHVTPPPVTSPPPVESDEARIIRLTAQAQAERPAPPLRPMATGTSLRQCTAISAATGRRCGRYSGHEGTHVHGSTPFVMEAAPGQTFFTRLAELELHANRRDGAETLAAARNGAQEKAYFRRLAKARAGKARRAHDGAETTTGSAPLDRRPTG